MIYFVVFNRYYVQQLKTTTLIGPFQLTLTNWVKTAKDSKPMGIVVRIPADVNMLISQSASGKRLAPQGCVSGRLSLTLCLPKMSFNRVGNFGYGMLKFVCCIWG